MLNSYDFEVVSQHLIVKNMGLDNLLTYWNKINRSPGFQLLKSTPCSLNSEIIRTSNY